MTRRTRTDRNTSTCSGYRQDTSTCPRYQDRRVRFAVDKGVREPTAEPNKQDERAPIKMVSGRAWSPGIYQALRLLGKSLDVAWERAFINLRLLSYTLAHCADSMAEASTDMLHQHDFINIKPTRVPPLRRVGERSRPAGRGTPRRGATTSALQPRMTRTPRCRRNCHSPPPPCRRWRQRHCRRRRPAFPRRPLSPRRTLSSASRASPSILDKLSGLSIPGPNLAVASELWRSQRGRRGQMRSLRTLQSPPTSLKPYSRLYCRMDFRGFGGHACHCFGQAVPPHPPQVTAAASMPSAHRHHLPCVPHPYVCIYHIVSYSAHHKFRCHKIIFHLRI